MEQSLGSLSDEVGLSEAKKKREEEKEGKTSDL
jgi:hypothetical protein